ncbi:MAG TPA: hypothetical protein VHO47_04585 [Candidatus Babeliales bacterium]|nr:hypothetical protein [Candidatus Babeliales bacterium]
MNYSSGILVLLLLFSQNAIQSFDQKNLYAAAGIGALTLVGVQWCYLHQVSKKIVHEKRIPFILEKEDSLKDYLQPYCPIFSSTLKNQIEPEELNKKKNGETIESTIIFKKYKFPFLFYIENNLTLEYTIQGAENLFSENKIDLGKIKKHTAQVKPVFYTVPLLSFFAGWMGARITQSHPKKI